MTGIGNFDIARAKRGRLRYLRRHAESLCTGEIKHRHGDRAEVHPYHDPASYGREDANALINGREI
jgi:hypothetical protein